MWMYKFRLQTYESNTDASTIFYFNIENVVNPLQFLGRIFHSSSDFLSLFQTNEVFPEREFLGLIIPQPISRQRMSATFAQWRLQVFLYIFYKSDQNNKFVVPQALQG